MVRQASIFELQAHRRAKHRPCPSSGTKRMSFFGSTALRAIPALIGLTSAAAASGAPSQNTPPAATASQTNQGVQAAAPSSGATGVTATSKDANPEGLYYGTMTFRMGSATYPLFAIVLKDGSTSLFVRTSSTAPGSPDGFALRVAIRPRGSVFSAQFTALTQPEYQLGNLPYFPGASGTINGVIQPGGSISGRFMTPHDTGSFSLKPMGEDYGRPASGETIAGIFDHDFPVKGATVLSHETVRTDGTASGSDDATRCVVSQKYTIPDPAHNAYRVVNKVACGSGAPKEYVGIQAFFPKGTGAAWNEGENFQSDTIVTITEGDRTGYMKIATKRPAPGTAASVKSDNLSLAGLYQGQMTVAGTTAKYPVFAIVLKDGTASIFATTSMPAPDSPQGFAFSGVVFKPTGSEFETSFIPYTQPGNEVALLKGFAGTPGMLRGKVKPGVSITGTYTNPIATGTLTLMAMPEEYGRMASGDDIAGVYDHVFTTNGMQVIGYETIKPDGTNIHRDDFLGCPVYQIYLIPDRYHNTYTIENKLACPNRPLSLYQGLEAFFPRGTGAAVNGGVPFTTNTILAITENKKSGFLKIAK